MYDCDRDTDRRRPTDGIASAHDFTDARVSHEEAATQAPSTTEGTTVTSWGLDFTYTTYRDLLEAGLTAGYEFLTVEQYLRRKPVDAESLAHTASDGVSGRPKADGGDGLPEKFVILRHDIDRKPENALAMARLEAEHGISGTYYVRTIGKTFKPALIRRIEALGHEVGYHFEDLDRADGDQEAALSSFRTELDKLRTIVDVDTVCMHGNPLTPYDNRDLLKEADFADFDLLGEAYLSADFTDLTYFSDTGRTWRDGPLKVKDHTMGEGEKDVQVDTTFELIGLLLTEEVDHPYVLVHPNRWAGSYPEFVSEHAKDTAVNVVKRGLNLLT